MRRIAFVIGLMLGAIAGVACAPPIGILELSSRGPKVYDDGTTMDLFVLATDKKGNPGKGVVTLTAAAGTLADKTITLDSYGSGRTSWVCNVAQDPACAGKVDLGATWAGATADLTLDVVNRCPGLLLCNGACVDVVSDWNNCGACGKACRPDQVCKAGACGPCPNGDCDGDGWSADAGDCCDQVDQCDRPAAVNPGAIEVAGNNLDDNCNGLLDQADTADFASCDTGLGAYPDASMDFARALGLCRVTTETARTWGVLSAELLLVDGSPNVAKNSATLRPRFGVLDPLEGGSVVVLSSGAASDAVQTAPSYADGSDQTTADLTACKGQGCLNDWFQASRPPLKLKGQLPGAPGCAVSASNSAFDSAMVRLRIRAPTNAVAFKLKSRFFSEEYPEYVCSNFNDQMVLLVDTGSANVGNPSDKNLMTYTNAADGGAFPVGINLAVGTPLFQSCTTQAQAPECWDDSVNLASCQQGPGALAQTQFSAPPSGGCVRGGATGWMVTKGNVKPGGVFELRAAIWDVGDHALDSLVVLDGFEWAVDAGAPGTE